MNHLTLARCALYAARLEGHPPEAALEPAERAVAGLRAAGHQHMLPLGLLTRAHLRHALGDPAAAAADLAEVRRIAERGGMRLHLADYHLHHARLFPGAEGRPGSTWRRPASSSSSAAISAACRNWRTRSGSWASVRATVERRIKRRGAKAQRR